MSRLFRHIAAAALGVVLAAPLPALARDTPPSAAADAAVHYRSIRVNGFDIFYREAGPRDAPVVVLLHGFPASSFMYRDLIPKLAARYHVIAPDYPGFGYSAAPPPKAFAYSFDRLADVIDAFTAQLGLKRYALYMQDFGGPVGFRLASRHPGQVSALIIQNANAYAEGLPDGFWSLAKTAWRSPTRAHLEKLRAAAMAESALAWNYTHGVADPSRISPDSWMLQRALLSRPGNRDAMLALLYDYRKNLELYPAWQAYFRRYQPPTLIVWGEHDAIFPAPGAEAYRRDLPKAEVHLLDTGHFALEDKSGEIGGLMLDFLDRTVTSGR